ncbi:MAG: endo-1,4-beta-xylanase [Bacteroidales bacterium]|nr:endo-1,4-beta-xylanase [Bacteroidales bacterium]
MKKIINNNRLLLYTGIVVLMVFFTVSCSGPEKGLKDIFSGYFYIGTAVNPFQLYEKDTLAKPFIAKHFNSITNENCLKWERVHPSPGVYNFAPADSMVAFGQRNNMFIVGHCLVWHSQTPKWVFEDSLGNPLTRDALLERMKDHIFTVVGRYKGKIGGWDVVNEAVGDDGRMRKSNWSEIIGDDFVQKAFEFAREADPGAELYYNDYNIELPGKREGAVTLLRNLMDNGVKIDGVGIQGHWHLESPALQVIDTSIKIFTDMGLKVLITELDVNVIPEPMGLIGAEISQNFEYQKLLNPYPESLPDSVQQKLAGRYTDLFNTFIKYKEGVGRVTFWGVHDGYSWKNNWPIRGRTTYPLLFDRNYQPKPAYNAVINTVKK